ETLTVNLSGLTPLGTGVPGTPGGTITTVGSPATGTINNDDSATITIGNASVVEGGNLVFTVTLSNAVQGGVTVDYATSNGTAGDGTGGSDSDYTAASGTLSFAGAAGSQTITVATTS